MYYGDVRQLERLAHQFRQPGGGCRQRDGHTSGDEHAAANQYADRDEYTDGTPKHGDADKHADSYGDTSHDANANANINTNAEPGFAGQSNRRYIRRSLEHAPTAYGPVSSGLHRLGLQPVVSLGSVGALQQQQR
jgi:hypothetical protein